MLKTWPVLRHLAHQRSTSCVPVGGLLRDYLEQFFPNATLSFISSSEMSSYIGSRRYGKFPDTPGLWAAVILTKIPANVGVPGEWGYTIRMNASQGRFSAFDYQGVPDTFEVKQKDDLQVR